VQSAGFVRWSLVCLILWDVQRPALTRLERAASLLRRLARDEGAAVSPEYVVLVGTVGLLLVGAIVGVGPLLVTSYERSRALLLAPFP
jgi:Flp pilus assembly pilin Flp